MNFNEIAVGDPQDAGVTALERVLDDRLRARRQALAASNLLVCARVLLVVTAEGGVKPEERQEILKLAKRAIAKVEKAGVRA